MIGRWNGENSVVLRHEAEERRRDRMEAQERAEAIDWEALIDDEDTTIAQNGPKPPQDGSLCTK